MKIRFSIVFLMVSVSAFAQDSFWSFSPEIITSLNVSEAHEHWIFFNEEGEPNDTMELVSFYFHADGRKKYIIEHTLDIVETRDSIVYDYDDQGREILRTKHIQINPRNFEIDTSFTSRMDTIRQWRTDYRQNKVILIDHRSDSTVKTMSSSGDVLRIQNDFGDTRYFYDKKGRLTKMIEIEKARVFGGNVSSKVLDSVVTTYKRGNPISTIGEKTTIAYLYEKKQLVSELKTSEDYGETRVRRTEYDYNQAGQLIEERVSVNGAPRYITRYVYDENGILIRDISVDPTTGKNDLIIETTYR